MTTVFPDLQLLSNIEFEEIDVRQESTKIILIHGLGTKIIKHQDTSQDKITLCDYQSKGIIRDALTLIKDLKTDTVQTRTERLNNLIISIRLALQNENYNQVVLIGCSHGSIIMYSALVEIEADILINLLQLKKLRFFALSPPAFFPANTLSYNSFSKNVNKHFLAFAHIHYRDDPFYNKTTKFTNPLQNLMMNFAKSRVIHKVSKYYDMVLNSIQSKSPENKCFFYDTSRTTIFLIPFPQGNSNAYFLDSMKNEYRYIAAFHMLNIPTHADASMLYPILMFSDIKRALISNLAGGKSKENQYILILGKRRKIINKGRWSYVKYKGQMITLESAQKIA